METLTSLAEARACLDHWRARQERIALVPTMGNLHPGHLALVGKARQLGGRVVVTLFVNPLQFSPGEDFATYPRTFDEDQHQLRQADVDLLFAPAVDEVYPRGPESHTRVEVPGLSDVLCGADRPGHFVGVATLVCKLFNMVQPHWAVFGEKDLQQLLVIRRMAADLCFPIQIVGVATVREADGLAMSSRNGYLSPAERRRAPVLFQGLRQAAEACRAGAGVSEVERSGSESLRAAGFLPDYFRVCRSADLAAPDPQDRDLVVLAAAYLGKARLIDNLRFRR
jgi:pantoate--beta-alanine ligase